MSKSAPGVRYGEIERETGETRVRVVLDLDGGTKRNITTGIGFFDHMLDLFAHHGQIDLGIQAEGDLKVDDHHTVEDIGIVLGKAFAEALETEKSINRYASLHSPMDETLVLIAIDISGRPGLYYEVPFKRENLGELATENIREFLKAFATHAKLTLHVRYVCGENDHHIAEAIFKGLGRALHEATRPSDRRGSTSTKGMID